VAFFSSVLTESPGNFKVCVSRLGSTQVLRCENKSRWSGVAKAEIQFGTRA
jgi:hypothetical protein